MFPFQRSHMLHTTHTHTQKLSILLQTKVVQSQQICEVLQQVSVHVCILHCLLVFIQQSNDLTLGWTVNVKNFTQDCGLPCVTFDHWPSSSCNIHITEQVGHEYDINMSKYKRNTVLYGDIYIHINEYKRQYNCMINSMSNCTLQFWISFLHQSLPLFPPPFLPLSSPPLFLFLLLFLFSFN